VTRSSGYRMILGAGATAEDQRWAVAWWGGRGPSSDAGGRRVTSRARGGRGGGEAVGESGETRHMALTF
jgi:hypothetical protein